MSRVERSTLSNKTHSIWTVVISGWAFTINRIGHAIGMYYTNERSDRIYGTERLSTAWSCVVYRRGDGVMLIDYRIASVKLIIMAPRPCSSSRHCLSVCLYHYHHHTWTMDLDDLIPHGMMDVTSPHIPSHEHAPPRSVYAIDSTVMASLRLASGESLCPSPSPCSYCRVRLSR